MEFNMGLEKSKCKDIMFVVMDSLTNYAHFCEIQSIDTSSQVVKVFMKEIYRLHGS